MKDYQLDIDSALEVFYNSRYKEKIHKIFPYQAPEAVEPDNPYYTHAEKAEEDEE